MTELKHFGELSL